VWEIDLRFLNLKQFKEVNSMVFQVLDPSSEAAVASQVAALRLGSLQGKTIGFISNGKEGTRGYFAHLEQLLRDECGVHEVVHRVKSNYSAPADAYIIEEARQWDAAVSGIGD
jgi:hypothetical protein